MRVFRPLPLVCAIAAVLALGACARQSAPVLADKGDAQRELRDRKEVARSLELAPPPPPASRQPVSPAPMVAQVIAGSVSAEPYAELALTRSGMGEPTDREQYADIATNPVIAAREQPVSTFSVDVDTGSYSNVRRFLSQGMLPPTDAVRIEEFINYFDYNYTAPPRGQPFSVATEVATAPWNKNRWLMKVGLKGFEVPFEQMPASNLVFLLDVSGSMQDANKLPLVKTALRMVVDQMRPQDRIAIVVYAGAAGLVLPSTAASDKQTILAALDSLEAGGSTNGGQGIQLAYQVAREHFVANGVNRVILATDGDFNVGMVDQQDLEDLIERQRTSGIALTTLGFGQGNYRDVLAERLADLGNGNHAYIDSEREARKVLVRELGANLLTIAKDVKIQIEFNPAVVAEYRLIGYENRVLAREDFNNDAVDAGEIGAGHTVTALYELTPVGSDSVRLPPLRYGANQVPAGGKEIAFLKLRYKAPDGEQSRLIETPIAQPARIGNGSAELRFAAAVAAFGERLRGGKYLDNFGYHDIAALATSADRRDPFELEAEFIDLVARAEALDAAREVAIAE